MAALPFPRALSSSAHWSLIATMSSFSQEKQRRVQRGTHVVCETQPWDGISAFCSHPISENSLTCLLWLQEHVTKSSSEWPSMVSILCSYGCRIEQIPEDSWSLTLLINIDTLHLFCHVSECEKSEQLRFCKFEWKNEFNIGLFLLTYHFFLAVIVSFDECEFWGRKLLIFLKKSLKISFEFKNGSALSL